MSGDILAPKQTHNTQDPRAMKSAKGEHSATRTAAEQPRRAAQRGAGRRAAVTDTTESTVLLSGRAPCDGYYIPPDGQECPGGGH